MDHNEYGKGIFDENEHNRGRTFVSGMAGVYGLMFLGLLASAAAAMFTLSSDFMWSLVFGHQFGFWAFLFAPLLLVMFAFPRVWGMSPGAALGLFFVYALINGLTLAVIFLAYDMGTIFLAFFSAAGMFGVMAVYGALTKADLSGMRSFLLMGLFGIIIASVLNFFFANGMLDMIISYVGIAIFLGLTAYDVQRIQRAMNDPNNPNPTGVAVLGALHLYLDFLNIFLFMLRILGRRR
ncbi:MAG: Bax inhibitor-1/YccA family protein [Oscillospiraceae bacterium]|nr:Bax inhibitor-1/YccA family protein [Oscillospiraceae bacterium]